MRSKTRIRDDHLISRVEDSAQQTLDPLHIARRDDDVMFGCDTDAGAFEVLSGSSLSEFGQTVWQRVLSHIGV